MKGKNTGIKANNSNEYYIATDRFHFCVQEHTLRMTHAYLFGHDLCLLEPCSQVHPNFGTHCFDSVVHDNGLRPNPWQFYQAAPQSIRKEDLVNIVWGRKETQQFILNDCFGPFISQDEQLLATEYGNRFPQFMPVAILQHAEESIYCIRMSARPQEEKFKFMRDALTGHQIDDTGMPPCYHNDY